MDFIEELKAVKERYPYLRYGQILNNALQTALGRKECDCNNKFDCKCRNMSGAAYDTFHISDSDLAKAIKQFREACR